MVRKLYFDAKGCFRKGWRWDKDAISTYEQAEIPDKVRWFYASEGVSNGHPSFKVDALADKLNGVYFQGKLLIDGNKFRRIRDAGPVEGIQRLEALLIFAEDIGAFEDYGADYSFFGEIDSDDVYF